MRYTLPSECFRKKVKSLNQSALTQAAKRADLKNLHGEYTYLANGTYHPKSRYVAKIHKLFEEKIKRDLEELKASICQTTNVTTQ